MMPESNNNVALKSRKFVKKTLDSNNYNDIHFMDLFVRLELYQSNKKSNKTLRKIFCFYSTTAIGETYE